MRLLFLFLLYCLLTSSFASTAQNWKLPLDHVFFRLDPKTYKELSKSKALKNSSSFYVDLDRDYKDYQAHYFNGLQSYVEIFDSSKADQMKYVGESKVGLGFRNEDFESFDALEKKLTQENPPCKLEFYNFEKSRFIHCRVQHLNLIIHAFSPGPGLRVTRFSSAEYLRKERKVRQVPAANDAIETVLSLNTAHTQSLSVVLKILGWTSKESHSWCRAEQCIRVTPNHNLKEPKLVSVSFSTTRPTKENFSFNAFSIQSLGPRKLILSLGP